MKHRHAHHTFFLFFVLAIASCQLICPVLTHAQVQNDGWATQDRFFLKRYKYQDSTQTVNYTVAFDGVAAADTLHCIVLGSNLNTHTFARLTTDGGKTWDIVRIDSTTEKGYCKLMRGVAFPRPDLCLITADSGCIYRSTDTCKHWTETRLPTSTLIWSVSMYDSLNGIVAGGYSQIYRTTDAGLSWLPVPPPVDTVQWGFRYAYYTGPGRYVLLGTPVTWANKTISRTTDGGQTWQRSSTDTINDLCFIDSLEGWGVGYGLVNATSQVARDVMYHTTDGGEHWTLVMDSLGDSPDGLGHIKFADRMHGIAVGFGGKILRTSDGGVTWRQESKKIEYDQLNFTGIAYPTPGKAWVSSPLGYIIHYDASRASGIYVPETPRTGHGGLVVRIRQGSNQGNTIQVEYSGTATGHITVGISDMLGRSVRAVREVAGQSGSGMASIDVNDVTAGWYLLRFYNGQQVISQPFVVSR